MALQYREKFPFKDARPGAFQNVEDNYFLGIYLNKVMGRNAGGKRDARRHGHCRWRDDERREKRQGH